METVNANFRRLTYIAHGVAGLDCWIAQSGLQSSLVDWIVNLVLPLLFKSKISELFYQEIKIE